MDSTKATVVDVNRKDSLNMSASNQEVGSLKTAQSGQEVELDFADAVEVNGLYGIFASGSPLIRKLFWTSVVLVGVGE